MSDLKTLLSEVSRFVPTLDLADPATAEAKLNEQFPPEGEVVSKIIESARGALARGEICHMENEGIKFSRVVKPKDDVVGCSIDAVLMENGQGPAHTHTLGEVCLCIHEEGSPAFDGRREPWVVMAKESRHRPTVTDGRMLIVYWWPEGAVVWG